MGDSRKCGLTDMTDKWDMPKMRDGEREGNSKKKCGIFQASFQDAVLDSLEKRMLPGRECARAEKRGATGSQV